MKKQFVALMTVLGMSIATIGCSPATSEKELSVGTTVETETPSIEETATPELPSEEELPTEDQSQDTAEENQDVETLQPVETEKPSDKEEVKLESKPTETTKPNNNTSSNSTSTNKPTTSKPQTSPSPSPSPKPETSPTPSPTPDVKPEVTPEVKPEPTSLSSSEVFSKMTSGLELPGQVDVDATLLSDLYGIDTSLLEDFCVKMPMMSFHITEVGVFKVKDVNNVSKIVDGINQRANSVGAMLYPSLQETFDTRVITTKGNYILFAMAENAAAIAENFNNLI